MFNSHNFNFTMVKLAKGKIVIFCIHVLLIINNNK